MSRYQPLLLGALLLASTWPLAQPQAQAEERAARQLYLEHCATCHGPDLRGSGQGPALSPASYRYGGSRDDFARIIRNGIASQGMPAFDKTLGDAEIAALADLLPARVAAEENTAEPEAPPARVFDPVPGEVTTLDYVIAVEQFVSGVDTPWAMVFLDARTALLTERPGRLRVIKDGKLLPEPVANTPEVMVSSHMWNQGGLLDVALDPEYASNGWIYLAYSHPLPSQQPRAATRAMTRVVRGRIRDHAWVDQQTVFEAPPESYGENFWHYGGRLAFDRSGALLVSIGDRGVQEQAREPLQPNGKLMRVNTDGTIPQDNPFRNRPTALPTLFTRGHRNPQGLAVEPATGALWATEHGPRGGDELNLIKAGADYGWPVASYGINYDGTLLTPATHAPGVEQPIKYWRPSIGVSGLTFYQGDSFPLWRGKLLVTALGTRDLRLLTLADGRVLHEEILLRTEGRPYEAIVGPEGEIYVLNDDPGQILKVRALRQQPR